MFKRCINNGILSGIFGRLQFLIVISFVELYTIDFNVLRKIIDILNIQYLIDTLKY